jgi:glutathione S-transferase
MPIEVAPQTKCPKDLSSTGQMPVLHTRFGGVSQHYAILRYIAGNCEASGLYGKTAFQSAQVDQWLDFCLNELDTVACVLIWLENDWVKEENKKTWTKAAVNAKVDVFRLLGVLEGALKAKTFLVGDDVTAADIAVAQAVSPLLVQHLTAAELQPFQCTFRWFMTCVNQPHFIAVLGKAKGR